MKSEGLVQPSWQELVGMCEQGPSSRERGVLLKHRDLSVLEVKAHLVPEKAPDKVFPAGEQWTGDGRGTWWQLTMKNSKMPQCNNRRCGCHMGCKQEPPHLVNVEVVGSLREFTGHEGTAEGQGVSGTVTLAVWRRKQSQR